MKCLSSIKDLRLQTGMTQKEFSEYLHVPFRSLQNWEGGQRSAPEYLAELIEYKLKNEKLIK